jgi:hypothetical protein
VLAGRTPAANTLHLFCERSRWQRCAPSHTTSQQFLRFLIRSAALRPVRGWRRGWRGRCRRTARPRSRRLSPARWHRCRPRGPARYCWPGDQPNHKGDQPAQPNADDAAEHAEQRGFGQELHQNIPAPRANRFAQADFARALGDRDQHDVHNADAAHQQRDGGDAAQEDGQHAGDGARRLDKILLRKDREIVQPNFGAVALAQDLRNFFGSRTVSGLVAWTKITSTRSRVRRSRRVCAVLNGTSTTASWLPKELPPLASSTPITRYGWPSMRMVSPTTPSRVPKSLSAFPGRAQRPRPARGYAHR